MSYIVDKFLEFWNQAKKEEKLEVVYLLCRRYKPLMKQILKELDREDKV